MHSAHLRSGISHVGQALRMPEEFAFAWNDGTARYRWWVWCSLMATAILGTTTYGMTMGLLGGAGDVLYKGLACTLAAGLAWGIPLPALYILNSNWFFSVAVPHPAFVLAVNLTVFAGVGVAMIHVFHRVMRSLEPRRETAPTWWLVLVGVIGAELFYFFGLFQFHFVH